MPIQQQNMLISWSKGPPENNIYGVEPNLSTCSKKCQTYLKLNGFDTGIYRGPMIYTLHVAACLLYWWLLLAQQQTHGISQQTSRFTPCVKRWGAGSFNFNYPLVIHGRRENCLLQTYEVGYGRPKKFSGVAAAANVEAPLPQKRRGRAYKKSIRQRSQTSWEMVGIVDWFIDPSEPKHILFGFYIWDWTPWRKGWTQVVDEAGSTPHWKHLHRTWSQTAQQKTTRLQMICRSACNLGDFPLPHFNCTQRERYYKLIIQTVFAMFPLLHQAPWGWPLALLSRSIWQLLVKPNFQRSKLLCAIGFSTRRFLSRKSFWSSKTQKACTLAIAFGSCKALQWRSYPTSPREPARLL